MKFLCFLFGHNYKWTKYKSEDDRWYMYYGKCKRCGYETQQFKLMEKAHAEEITFFKVEE